MNDSARCGICQMKHENAGYFDGIAVVRTCAHCFKEFNWHSQDEPHLCKECYIATNRCPVCLKLKHMDITFKPNDKNPLRCIDIMSRGKVIGQMFTPGGSARDEANVVQVCGFDDAFHLWGCGVFGERALTLDKETLERGDYVHKRDIQLLFSDYVTADVRDLVQDANQNCAVCFNKPCICDVKLPSRKLVLATYEEIKNRLQIKPKVNT